MRQSYQSVVAFLLVATLGASCTGVSPPPPTGMEVTARVMTRDFHTRFDEDAAWSTIPEITAPFFIVQQEGGPTTSAEATAMNAAARDGISLVELASGQRVDGEVVVGLADWRGEHSSAAESRAAGFSFVPARELADGWYVLRVDLSGWRPFVTDLNMVVANLPIRQAGDRAYVRVHVGSLPVWWATSIRCTFDHAEPLVNTSCQISVVASEPVADWGDTMLEVSVDGVPVTCELVTSDEGIGCRLDPFQTGAAIDLHYTSSLVATPDGSHDERRRIVFDAATASAGLVEVSPDFGIAIADGAR